MVSLKSQLFVCSPTNVRNKFPTLLLTTSVWPSVWDEKQWRISVLWLTCAKVFFKSNFWISHQTIQFDSTVKKYLNSKSICNSRIRKWAILEKQSTTTKIESCFLKIFGKPNTKYVLTSCQEQFRMGSAQTSVLFLLFS